MSILTSYGQRQEVLVSGNPLTPGTPGMAQWEPGTPIIAPNITISNLVASSTVKTQVPVVYVSVRNKQVSQISQLPFLGLPPYPNFPFVLDSGDRVQSVGYFRNTIGSDITVSGLVASSTVSTQEGFVQLNLSGLVASSTVSTVDPTVSAGTTTITGLVATATVSTVDPTVGITGSATITGLVASSTVSTSGPTVSLTALTLWDASQVWSDVFDDFHDAIKVKFIGEDSDAGNHPLDAAQCVQRLHIRSENVIRMSK